jgi:putative oxidoreductase
MTTNLDTRLAGYHSPVLSLFRIVFGLLYLMHGTQKMFDWPIAAPAPIETGSFPFWWAGLIEVVLGILITLGLFTRLAAFIAAGEMAAAYFITHFPRSFWPAANMGEAAILFCFVFLYIAAAGPGAWSVDGARFRNRMPR